MSRRTLAGIAGALAIAIAALFALRGPIALRVVRRIAERTLATDGVAALPDGLHVVLCGAGSPLPDPERSGACAAVIAGRAFFVVDAGSGAANLTPMGLVPGPLQAVFLTHLAAEGRSSCGARPRSEPQASGVPDGRLLAGRPPA